MAERSRGGGDLFPRLAFQPPALCKTPSMDDASRRIFIAVDLDDDLRHGLAAHLGEEDLPGKLPPPENWHITLRFIGKVDLVGLDRVTAALDQADLGESFRLGFAGLGAFPRPARATVLWLGTGAGTAELTALATAVEESVVSAGFGREERPFHPHLTLSRIRPQQDVRGLIERMPLLPLSQRVDRITLFESQLGGGPAVYEALEEVELS